MPSHWAPCRVGAAGESPILVYGEEIVYADFSVPQPLFLTEDHEKWWRRQEHPERYQLLKGRAHFRGQHGQNLVFTNVVYKGTPPSSWADDACMAFGTTHRGLEPLPPDAKPQYPGRVILANTPDSWSYQHFLDRVTKLMTQSEPWRVAGPSEQRYQLLISKPSFPIPGDILEAALGIEGEVAPSSNEFSAAELVFSCRTPMSHPYFHERLWEVLKLPPITPLEQRKVVLYLSRNHGGTVNGGRRITNEEALLEFIRALLKQRGRGEQLVVFNVSSVPHVQDMAGFLFSNVSAVFGPHGGAWCNYIQFAAPDTLGIEFMPTDFFSVAIWEEASMRQRPFMVLPVPSINSQHDMEVDPALVGKALQKHLGRPSPQPEPQPSYTWDLATLSK